MRERDEKKKKETFHNFMATWVGGVGKWQVIIKLAAKL